MDTFGAISSQYFVRSPVFWCSELNMNGQTIKFTYRLGTTIILPVPTKCLLNSESDSAWARIVS